MIKHSIFLLIMILSSLALNAKQKDILSLVVGSYNEQDMPGMYSLKFNQATGQISKLDSLQIENPSYMAFNKEGDKIYVISELQEINSQISLVEFNKESGQFRKIKQLPLSGSPCYVSNTAKFLAIANYGGGSVDLTELDENGSLKAVRQIFKGYIGGSDISRQNLPHSHCAVFSLDKSRLYISDFSSDNIFYLDMRKESQEYGYLGERPRGFKLPDSTGPRHLIFDNMGVHAYLIGELSGQVHVFDINQNDLLLKQTINADPVHERASADIHLSPDGKHLYVSNRRKNDGLSIFEVEPIDGTLKFVGYQNTGLHPRHFNITPNGKYILVACRDSGIIEVYERNPCTGLLTKTQNYFAISKPVNIQIAP